MAVAKDAARGDGEFLTAYGFTFGCQNNELTNFKKVVQKEFPMIFGQMGVENILLATHVKLRLQEDIAEGCEYVY